MVKVSRAWTLLIGVAETRLAGPPHAFGRKDVWLSRAIRVGHHTDNPETDFEIELVRVIGEVSNALNRPWSVRVEVCSTETGLAVLVVAAGPEGDR